MKQLLFVVLLFGTTLPISAQNHSLEFSTQAIPELIETAQHSGKLIFVDMTATWCKPCKEMEKTTFTDPSVLHYFSEHFLSKKIVRDKDLPQPDSISSTLKKRTQVFPTFYFLDSSGEVLFTRKGFKTPAELLNLAQKAKHTTSPEYQISKMQKAYAGHKNDKDFLYRYLKLKSKTEEKDSKALYDYLKLVSYEKLYAEKTIGIIIKHESDIYGKGYNILSSDHGRTQASIMASKNKGNLSIGYDMYKASLGIIKKNAALAAKNNDRNLLAFCIAEINRVMQNKSKARKLARDFEIRFENKNGNINL